MASTGDPLSVPLKGEDLDPDIRRFVREMGRGWAEHPGFATAPPHEARRIAEQVRAPWTRGGPRVDSTEHCVVAPRGDVRIRCYGADSRGPKPALVYLHGGGWTLFSLETHDRLMREYAARAGVVVVGVDYALSPESKYPEALDQVFAVTRFLRLHGGELGIDPLRMALGGDSAGANLATAASLRLRDEGDESLVRGMVLNYGVFDRWSSPDAHLRFGGEGYMLSSAEMEVFWANYLRDEHDLNDPLVCPINADLRRLPPALLVVPVCDLLAEQSVRMAARLREAGVRTALRLYEGASHSFLEAVSIARLADRAFSETADWLRETLAEVQS